MPCLRKKVKQIVNLEKQQNLRPKTHKPKLKSKIPICLSTREGNRKIYEVFQFGAIFARMISVHFPPLGFASKGN